MAGVDLRTVRQLMGHKAIGMTVRYADLAPEHQLSAVHKVCPGSQEAQHGATDTTTRRTSRSKHQLSVAAKPN
jgi:hypothetical protein